MGYKPKRKTYRLRFEDPEMKGLVVEMHSVPLGTFKKIIRLGEAIESGDTQAVEDSGADAVHELFTMFSEAMVSWNVEDDAGEPVPTTVEGLETQDVDFVLDIARAWINAVGDVPVPLGQRSNGGVPSVVPSTLPMEPLSASRAS